MEEVLRDQDVVSFVEGMKAAHYRVEPDAAQSGGEQQDRRETGVPRERPETRRIVQPGSRLRDGRCRLSRPRVLLLPRHSRRGYPTTRQEVSASIGGCPKARRSRRKP